MNFKTPSQTIVVTGGAGFIGTHLCTALVNKGHKVKVLDLRTPAISIPGVKYFQGNVCNQTLLETVLEEAQAVFHLAATVSVPVCQNEPFESYSNNFSTTLAILETLRRGASHGRQSARLIFASTAALYGNKGQIGVALTEEETAAEFSSFYAAQKHASEQAIALYAKSYAIPALSFRYFNVFGPGQDPSSPYSGVISIFTKLAKQGKPLSLHGGGMQTRDFISVFDLVEAQTRVLNLAPEHWRGLPINLGTGVATSIKDLAQVVQEIVGSQLPTTTAPLREADVLHSLADISKAKRLLNFSPQYSLAQGLKDLL